jgi:hypothetical protein
MLQSFRVLGVLVAMGASTVLAQTYDPNYYDPQHHFDIDHSADPGPGELSLYTNTTFDPDGTSAPVGGWVRGTLLEALGLQEDGHSQITTLRELGPGLYLSGLLGHAVGQHVSLYISNVNSSSVLRYVEAWAGRDGFGYSQPMDSEKAYLIPAGRRLVVRCASGDFFGLADTGDASRSSTFVRASDVLFSPPADPRGGWKGTGLAIDDDRGGRCAVLDERRGKIVALRALDAADPTSLGSPNYVLESNDASGSSFTAGPQMTSALALAGRNALYDPSQGCILSFSDNPVTTRAWNPTTGTWMSFGAQTLDLGRFRWLQDGYVPPNKVDDPVDYAVVYDSTRGRTLLFCGGNRESSPAMWEYDSLSGGWTSLPSTTPAPSPRLGFALAYDAARQCVVLFGGRRPSTVLYATMPPTYLLDASALLGETWEWSSATRSWTQVATPTGPSPRQAHAMTYDRAHGKTVLYGGCNVDMLGLEDTRLWTWDGQSWATCSPTMGVFWHYFQGQVSLFFNPTTSDVDLFLRHDFDGVWQLWSYTVPGKAPPTPAPTTPNTPSPSPPAPTPPKPSQPVPFGIASITPRSPAPGQLVTLHVVGQDPRAVRFFATVTSDSDPNARSVSVSTGSTAAGSLDLWLQLPTALQVGASCSVQIDARPVSGDSLGVATTAFTIGDGSTGTAAVSSTLSGSRRVSLTTLSASSGRPGETVRIQFGRAAAATRMSLSLGGYSIGFDSDHSYTGPGAKATFVVPALAAGEYTVEVDEVDDASSIVGVGSMRFLIEASGSP